MPRIEPIAIVGKKGAGSVSITAKVKGVGSVVEAIFRLLLQSNRNPITPDNQKGASATWGVAGTDSLDLVVKNISQAAISEDLYVKAVQGGENLKIYDDQGNELTQTTDGVLVDTIAKDADTTIGIGILLK